MKEKKMKLPSIRALSFVLLRRRLLRRRHRRLFFQIWHKMIAVSAGNGPRLGPFLGFGAVGVDLI